jgi:hypothetical protein
MQFSLFFFRCSLQTEYNLNCTRTTLWGYKVKEKLHLVGGVGLHGTKRFNTTVLEVLMKHVCAFPDNDYGVPIGSI